MTYNFNHIKPTTFYLVIIPFIILFINACSQPKDRTTSDKTETKTDADSLVQMPMWGSFLDSNLLLGSVLIYDAELGQYFSNDFERCTRRFLPASTFKIANTIIGLETGVIDADTTMFIWDGIPRRLKIWEKDMQLADAFRLSCVPCYQDVARRIGSARMNEMLNEFQYGSMDVNDDNIDRFWLEGNSGITQYEQIEFLRKLHNRQLSLNETTYNSMREIMLLDSTSSYTLRGKTGWVIRDDTNTGWFVGYCENGTNTLYFATNIEPAQGFDIDEFPGVRLRVTVDALSTLLK